MVPPPPPPKSTPTDFVPDQERLRKLASSAPSKIGGKGTIRRRAKRAHHHHHQVGNADDERKLQASYKRLGMNTVTGIEEVNFFKTNGEVMHFISPKVQASIGSNTFAITGPHQNQEIGKMLPGIMSQLGADLFTRKFANVIPTEVTGSQQDDEIPDLVNADFEEASIA